MHASPSSARLIPALARLFLETLNDRTLIILIIAAVVNIALGMTTENIRCVGGRLWPG